MYWDAVYISPIALLPTASVPAVLMVMERACCTEADKLSVTLAVKFDVPVALGVPLMTPVDALRLKPGGKFPETVDQV